MDNVEKLQQEVERQSRQLGIAAGHYMEEHGITQLAVEQVIGRGGGYVSKRISGKTHIDSQVLGGIATLAGVTVPTLMMDLAQRAAKMQ